MSSLQNRRLFAHNVEEAAVVDLRNGLGRDHPLEEFLEVGIAIQFEAARRFRHAAGFPLMASRN